MPHSVNFGRWLERLGIKDGREPDFIRAVQPVQVVGDVSTLVSPLLPPMAWAGGSIGAAAGEHAVLQLLSTAPGGTIVRQAGGSSVSGASRYHWRVSTASLTFVGGTTSVKTNYDMGPNPASSIVTIGRVLTANKMLNSDTPGAQVAGAASALVMATYVPIGQFFEIQIDSANFVGIWEIIFEDLPAAPGAQ